MIKGTVFLLLALLSSTLWAAKARKPYKLTILAYMNGYHQEDSAVEESINKMEAVGSTKDIAIIAEWGSLKRGKARRLLIEKDSDPHTVSSTVLSESVADMGSASTLEDFLLWGTQNFPAERIVVVLGGLGSGWPGFSTDKRTNTKISIPDLGKVMEKVAKKLGRKTDLLVFDVCLMSMVEVGMELSPSVQYMAAGMNLLTEDVWVPYDLVLKEVVSSGTTNPKIIGSIIARIYNDVTKEKIHSGGIKGIQYGVIDLGKLSRVSKSARELTNRLLELSTVDRKDLISKARAHSLKYFIPHYIDLPEVLGHVPAEVRYAKVRIAGQKYQAEVAGAVVYQAKSSYFPVASGLTVSLVPVKEFPVQDWERKYADLRWAKVTGWDQLLFVLNKEALHNPNQ